MAVGEPRRDQRPRRPAPKSTSASDARARAAPRPRLGVRARAWRYAPDPRTAPAGSPFRVTAPPSPSTARRRLVDGRDGPAAAGRDSAAPHRPRDERSRRAAPAAPEDSEIPRAAPAAPEEIPPAGPSAVRGGRIASDTGGRRRPKQGTAGGGPTRPARCRLLCVARVGIACQGGARARAAELHITAAGAADAGVLLVARPRRCR